MNELPKLWNPSAGIAFDPPTVEWIEEALNSGEWFLYDDAAALQRETFEREAAWRAEKAIMEMADGNLDHPLTGS